MRRGSRVIALRPKVFDLLHHLVLHRDRTVTKDELIAQVWGRQIVGDAAMASCIKELRQAVGDSGAGQQIVQTVHGRGYRFIATVCERKDAATGPAARTAEVTTPGTAPPTTARLQPASPQQPAASEGEHKTASVLVCGFADAARLKRQLGTERMHGLRRALVQTAREVVGRLGGTVLHELDDSVVAILGAAPAHEDHAHRAVLAIVQLRDALAQRVEMAAATRAAGEPPRVSAAAHCGPVVAGGLEAGATAPFVTAVGDTIRLAQRLQGEAQPGAIVLSAALRARVGEQVTTRPLPSASAMQRATTGEVEDHAGETPLQGAVEVVALRSPTLRGTVLAFERPRGLTPFVGRAAELALLRSLWTRAAAGRGQVVGVVGEPGVGKSRLLHELCLGLLREGATVVAGQCVSYGQATPYLPLGEPLRCLCGIEAGAPPAALHRTARLTIDRLELSQTDDLPLLLGLLGTTDPRPERSSARPAAPDPQALKARTFELLRRLIAKSAATGPLLLALEDLHWIDATTNEWLELLAQGLARMPVLLIATYRPGYRPPWIDRSYATQQALPPLAPDECVTLVRRVVGPHASPATIDAILAHGEGNPLFLEELAHAALEQPSTSLRSEAGVPETVQGVLAARIDRLDAAAKAVLQLAAVAGREATLRLLCLVADDPARTLTTQLSALEAAEFLFELHDRPEPTWAFKHALIQDVAYATLLQVTRERLHGRVAQALVEHFPELVRSSPELVAQHFAAAGCGREALPFWRQAGQQAIERCAFFEAITHLRRGLDAIRGLPPGPDRDELELTFCVKLGTPLLMVKGHADPEVIATFARVRELCSSRGKTPELFMEFSIALVEGQLQGAHERAGELLALGEAAGDTVASLTGHLACAYAELHLGRYRRALQHVETGLRLWDPASHTHLGWDQSHDPGPGGLVYQALASWLLGLPLQAKAFGQQAVDLARAAGHPFGLALPLNLDAWHQTLHGDVETTENRALEAVEVGRKHSFPFWRVGGEILLGWVQARRGAGAPAVEAIRQSIAAWEGTGAHIGLPFFHTLLAEACSLAGSIDEGLEAVRWGIAAVDRYGEHLLESELYRWQGELLRRTPDADPAQVAAAFERALAIARSQEALSLELRAATSLARLHRDRGHGEAARDLLAPLYARFTEGLDEPDLREAREVLESLS